MTFVRTTLMKFQNVLYKTLNIRMLIKSFYTRVFEYFRKSLYTKF